MIQETHLNKLYSVMIIEINQNHVTTVTCVSIDRKNEISPRLFFIFRHVHTRTLLSTSLSRSRCNIYMRCVDTHVSTNIVTCFFYAQNDEIY